MKKITQDLSVLPVIAESWIYEKKFFIICDAMSDYDQLENTNY